MKYLCLALALLLTACASQTVEFTPSRAHADSTYTDTMRVIEAAAEWAPDGVRGDYKFKIQAVGKHRDIVYLSTEVDYRDQRNVSLALSPRVAEYLERKHGQSPEDYFLNKSVNVQGDARRVRIWFFSNNLRTDKYYYQTQIHISSPDQISEAI